MFSGTWDFLQSGNLYVILAAVAGCGLLGIFLFAALIWYFCRSPRPPID